MSNEHVSPQVSDSSFSSQQLDIGNNNNNKPIYKMQKSVRRALTGNENVRVRDAAKENLQKTSHVVKTRVRKVVTGSTDLPLREWAKNAQVVKAVDKFSFCLGVSVLCTTEYVLLEHPHHFGMYYVALLSVMMALRLYMYAKNKWLYFLLDFCYWVNASCVVSVLFAPDNVALWRLNYACTNGVLLGAILAWRNSLVFHSLDKVTSIAIHLLPGLLTFLQRWSPSGKMCTSVENDCSIDMTGAWLEPLLFYMCWQALYILKTEILDRQVMLANPDIKTSLRWLTRDAKNPMHQMAKRACRHMGVLRPDEDFDPDSIKTKFVFWIANLVFVLVTLLPIPILFASVKANTCYILLVLMAAVYNGSNYYFEVFAARYLQKLEETEKRNKEKMNQQPVGNSSLFIIGKSDSEHDNIAGNGSDTNVAIKQE